ncbi:hypothetical protein CLV58_11921 [Spirosoma oryzae]|uniref:Uncharacterized protein n=1 Tax=Spirosoma oryzae TaxID=1469603 RepID=A0A2T0SKD2_9BACT|nr:hypothetical protein [Spirosoma oryzae]PRY33872.1 hypothetical protein CLV58_11921 [Spirosoma oryzae]
MADFVVDPKDPKYLGIPNINFSLIDDSQDLSKARLRKYQNQRIKRGYDDTEAWDLGLTVAKFVLPRLKTYKKNSHVFFHELGEEGTEKLLDHMIEAMKLVISRDSRDHDVLADEYMQEGLYLFAKYWVRLWD